MGRGNSNEENQFEREDLERNSSEKFKGGHCRAKRTLCRFHKGNLSIVGGQISGAPLRKHFSKE